MVGASAKQKRQTKAGPLMRARLCTLALVLARPALADARLKLRQPRRSVSSMAKEFARQFGHLLAMARMAAPLAVC
jgi:hypothetical protein